MLTGENGILTQAQRAKNETEKAQANEQSILDSYEDYMKGTTGGQWDEEKEVNTPQLMTGMTRVSFNLPSEDGSTKGEVVKEGEAGFDENNWYDYSTSKWANAVTKDGSYWVWIPRYEYKIDGQTIDVTFIPTRQTKADEGYKIHPAFTDESSTNYTNGGWDNELAGIWVAKFEAGYASKNNSAPVVASNVNYSQTQVFAARQETGTGSQEWIDARNCLDGVYGSTVTAIKYPTFQPVTYSMNYISISDCYDISRALTDNGNIYGLSSSSTDSHLMKNSEWGAVAYLSWSKYGTNEHEPYKNNINVGNNITSVYEVTGLTTGTTNDIAKITSADDIKNINGRNGNTANNGIYAWDQLTGQKASSTQNMYGIYDLSGGVIENIAGYINNGNNNLRTYGSSVIVGGDTSTKYATVYPYKNDENSNLDTACGDNYIYYKNNGNMYGDAIGETSTSGTGSSSWNGDYSIFPGVDFPFTARGGNQWGSSEAGLFSFDHTDGVNASTYGFRPVLVAL